MTRNEWENLFVEAINALRKQVFVPYRTGNLKYNAIKGMWIGEKIFRIYIDEKVAPYVYFTNEIWKNKSGKNPHQGWVELMVDFIAKYISHKLGGTTTK